MNVQLATDIVPGNVDLVKLAEELGAGLRPPVDVWADHGIHTREDAGRILQLGSFAAMLADAQRRWNSDANIRVRIKEKALIAIEQGLPSLFEGMVNAKSPLNHRVEVTKIFSKLGGIDAEVAAAGGIGGAGGAGGVSITIDLSGRGEEGGKGPIVVVSAANKAEEVVEEVEEKEDYDAKRALEEMQAFYTAPEEDELGEFVEFEE